MAGTVILARSTSPAPVDPAHARNTVETFVSYRVGMTETFLFTAVALGVVFVAGLAIIGRSRATPRRGSGAAFDPGQSHMWFADSSSSSNDVNNSDCAPSDSSGCDGGSGGDGGGGSGGD